MTQSFTPLPRVPDHPALELELLDLWERERTFERLREQNANGPRWSFFDGPVTANKKLGVHTAWGRTLKDVFQRYKALRGFHQRYQNGFDCQGLWIEVGVERELGVNSKKEIEEFGLEEFARRCRDVVVWSSEELTRGSMRLGQWMDWGNDYFTFSDTNIEYIWKFLKLCHERGWLYLGHRSTEWCPRCGTSLSQHELTQAGVFQEKVDPSLFVRFPLLGRERESLVIWTTTPWTVPANVAAAVHPEAEYGRRENGEWVAVARAPDESFVERLPGSELVGWRYRGPFDDLPAVGGVEHRVIPWEEVSLDEGTGIVHIAPGCGPEDFDLSRVHDLPVLTPVDESGRFYDDYGWLHGVTTTESADQIVGRLAETGFLVEHGLYEHRYPHCWRCDTPLIWRISDDWFIAVDELRPKLLEANETVDWVPDYFGKRMADWLRNMGDWNISRRRYYGLPLPLYPCACGRLNVIGSRAELGERAVSGMEQLEELRRPWIDRVPIRCESCGEAATRIPDVGDVWLDAGIVPFSTLGWQNPEWVPEGFATGAARGLTRADLPDHAYWEQWFPADWVTEMREQIRLWFYSQLLMSVALVGRAPFRRVLGYEKMLDEHGREMHGSWGNMIDAEDAFERMGADVMRWQFCAQPPNQNLLFGFGPAHEIKRRLLTFWNSVKFLVDYANVEGFTPTIADLETGPPAERPLDRWLVARTRQFVREATEAYEVTLTADVIRAFQGFVEDLSNWYIRRSRRRFYAYDDAAFRTLWYAIAQALRVVAPVMPFLTDHLWRNLVRDGAASVHLAGWPEVEAPDETLLAEIAEVRRVVELGRQARATSGLKLRQPLRRLVVAGDGLAEAHAGEIADELRVKDVEFGEVAASELRVKPNLPVLGPKLGPALREVRTALAEGRFEALDGGRFRVNGHELDPEEVLVERVGLEGWAVAADDGLTVALEMALDDELILEGRALDLIHRVNSMRRDAGFELTDRIVLTLPESDRDLLVHEEWIEREVLAVRIEPAGVDGPQIAKAVTSPTIRVVPGQLKKPKANVYRAFLYLDGAAVLNSLSSLQGGDIDEVLVRRADEGSGEVGGELSAGAVRLKGGRKKGQKFEEELRRKRTEHSAAAVLLQRLQDEDAIGKIEGDYDDAVYRELEEHMLLELRARIRIHPLHQALAAARAFLAAAPTFGVEKNELAEIRSTIAMLEMLATSGAESKTFLAFAEAGQEKSYRLVLPVNERNLLVPLDEFAGTATFITQVDRILGPEDELLALRLMRNAPTLAMEREGIVEALPEFIGAMKELGIAAEPEDFALQAPTVVLKPIMIFK